MPLKVSVTPAGFGKTACYTVEFRVLEGDYTGRRVWMTRYFTPAALPLAKRDLANLGRPSRDKATPW